MIQFRLLQLLLSPFSLLYGLAVALRNRSAKKSAQAAHQKVTIDDLEKSK